MNADVELTRNYPGTVCDEIRYLRMALDIAIETSRGWQFSAEMSAGRVRELERELRREKEKHEHD